MDFDEETPQWDANTAKRHTCLKSAVRWGFPGAGPSLVVAVKSVHG